MVGCGFFVRACKSGGGGLLLGRGGVGKSRFLLSKKLILGEKPPYIFHIFILALH